MRFLLSLSLALGLMTSIASADDHEHECDLDFKVKNIDGETEDLEDYEGKVVLIVNVASKCGYTKQYTGLQDIYEKYKDKGFVVLGFPCNQFGGQEPGSEAEIKEFCTSKFDVQFPMFAKLNVKGSDASPLYQHLSGKNVGPAEAGDVSWNFEKFLIDRDGKLVKRFKSKVAPEDAELTSAIEKLL